MFDATIKFFVTSGPFIWPLLVCSMLSLTVILERGLALTRSRIIDLELADAIGSMRHG